MKNNHIKFIEAPIRKEFAEWILQGENLAPTEIRYFIKCVRMEVERKRELLLAEDANYPDEGELPLTKMESEFEHAWNKAMLKLAAKVYEDKAIRLRFLNQEIT